MSEDNKRFGMFGLTGGEVRALAEGHKGFIRYYTPDETKALLADDRPSWLMRRRSHGWSHSSVSTFIVLDGKLTFVGNADLYGQVHSSIGATSDNDFYRNPLASYRGEAVYGAVLLASFSPPTEDDPAEQALFVLNALTDG